LDEPTAGVDVELRKDMWQMVHGLKQAGVTIILTTHYIEEAEAMADRVGVISKGELLLVEPKAQLMGRLARKEMKIELEAPLAEIPTSLSRHELQLSDDGRTLVYTYKADGETGIGVLLSELHEAGIALQDVHTHQSS